MTPDQLRRIFEEGGPDFLSESATPAIDGQNVIDLLDTQTFYELQQKKYPADRVEILNKLQREHLVTEQPDGSYVITNLGALLCAKRLHIFGDLARKAPRVVVYDGTGKGQTILDMSGAKGYAIGFAGVITFVASHLPQNEIVEKALRTKIKMLPDEALREVIAMH